MVNQYTKRPAPTPHVPMGLPCGDCGLPGLGVRQVPIQGEVRQSVPMLICRFCHRGVPVGKVYQLSA